MTPQPIVITTLLVRNIHCPSCVSHATDVLHQHVPEIIRINVSIIDHLVRVEHRDDSLSRRIAQSLVEAGFEVDHLTVSDTAGNQKYAYPVKRHHAPVPPSALLWRPFMSKAQRTHLENCNACREERQWTSLARAAWRGITKRRKLNHHSSSATDLERGDQSEKPVVDVTSSATTLTGKLQHGEKTTETLCTATVLVEGMTCASCVSSITNEVQKMQGVRSVNVNLLANNARISFDKSIRTIEDIVEAIEDCGFEAKVETVESTSDARSIPALFQAKLSVEGMTCGSCVGTITRGLEELSFVKTVNVDLVGNGAVVELEDEADVEAVLEKIDDLGYDASIIEISPCAKEHQSDRPQERKVEIEVEGMFCSKCPEKINLGLRDMFGNGITITQPLTLESPHMTVLYTPSAPALTIRSILRGFKLIEPMCTATIYHPPSLEERSRAIRRKERTRIFRHLMFTFAVAIPTFIIGIVYMSLVPASNSTRKWLERPMWAGMATRMDWALFIMTTPVMFYGANIFHGRAVKEIWSLWRPRSKAPLLRRFYRFGSMNLLISAGTSVAYFSSLAVLIMDATSAMPQEASGDKASRSSTTYFDTVTFLTFFILIGKFLEAYSKAKTGDAVSLLVNLRPSEAMLIEESAESKKEIVTRIPVDQLEVGDIVSVPHGVCPPTDGLVEQEGSFLFDESSLTGESRPVKKSKGDKLFTGTVNISDPARLVVTDIGGKSMLDRIVNVVREGQAKRAPIERLADILTGYFTPIITFLAIGTWIIWLSLGESGALPQAWLDVERGGWAFWSVEFAIAVFVVACPCGIGLAAPTALFVGGGLAAKHGVLAQGGGEAFQEASRLDTIVFDKTGTLTEGKMKVTDVDIIDTGRSEQQSDIAYAIAKALEEASSHPIAHAIVEHCSAQLADQGARVTKAEVKEAPGHGLRGTFEVAIGADKVTYEALIGNERLLKSSTPVLEAQQGGKFESPVHPSVEDALFRFQSQGCSTAILALHRQGTQDGPFEPKLVFAITDPIRPEAHSVLNSLRAQNISVHMCTGDNQKTALAIASQLGIQADHVRSNVLPQDKAAYIKELQNPDAIKPSFKSDSNPYSSSRRKIVAFVGDGTNDTPALTVSDVSIAISHSTGSDIALTSASFILLSSSLSSILTLVTLSKRVFRRVKLNFIWAGIYNIVLIPVAAGVFYPIGADATHPGWRFSPVWASAAMALSSVSVVMSSLALRLPEIKFETVTTWMKSGR